jgi:hypothetical protein
VISLDGIEDVIKDVVERAIARCKQLSQDGYLALWIRDDGYNFERFVAIYEVRGFLEVGENTCDALVSRKYFWIAVVHDLAEPVGSDTID